MKRDLETIIEVYSEIASNIVENRLNNKGIEFEKIHTRDSSFPTLNSSEPIIKFIIHDVFKSELFHDIKEKIKISSSNKKVIRNKKPYLLIAYSIIISLLFLRQWHKYRGIDESKNFIYEFSFDGTTMYLVDKYTDETVNIFIDNNYDLNYEKNITLSDNGRIKDIFIDSNEDGYFEESKMMVNDTLYSTWHDLDQDGYFEIGRFTLEDNSVIEISDQDMNGKFTLNTDGRKL